MAGDFRSPGQGPGNSDGPVTNTKKKPRRGSSAAAAQAAAQQSPAINDLVPPPLSGYGDTIIASNPFDDTPPPSAHHPMMHHPGGPGAMSGPMQGPGGMGGGPGPGPPLGMMGHMGNMGGMNGQMNHHGQHMGSMGGPNMNNMGPNMGPNMSMGPGPPMGHPGMGGGGPGGPMGPGPMGGGPANCNVFNQSPQQGPPKPMPVSAGKIYPPDQPMVFNPQNPNAPPIYPCGICHKEVHDNDQAILCESGCNFWFHRICTGLTEAAYHLLTAEVYAEWVCDKCLNSKNIPLVKFKP